jgi:hypothetical protein
VRRHRLASFALVAALVLTASATPVLATPGPRALTLRLTDLPLGYTPLPPTCDAHPPIADIAPRAGRACEMEFMRLWTPPGARPGPATVISTVIALDNPRSAATALADPLRFASLALPDMDDPEVVQPAPAIGDEAVLLRSADGSAAVVWRSGHVLAGLLADASFRDRRMMDVQATLTLATVQQARIAAPTPLRPADNEGSEVALDDPGLDLPVWWLGRALPQRGRLPELRLLTSISPVIFGHVDDTGPILLYGRRHARAQVTLALVKPSFLSRPAVRRDLRRLRRDSCSQIRRLKLRRGRATIFQRSPRCPKLDVRKTPDALFDTIAVVVLPRVVLFIDADDCTSCHGPISRYESIAGVRRIVRALHSREPRALTL